MAVITIVTSAPPLTEASREETPSPRPRRPPAAEVIAVHPDVAAAPVDVERARDDFGGDDLPNMRGIDGLKGNSPLGLEPKGEGIQGQSGYKVSGQTEQTPAAAPAQIEEPKTKTNSTTQSSSTGAVGSVRNNQTALPVAKAVLMDTNPSSVKPW